MSLLLLHIFCAWCFIATQSWQLRKSDYIYPCQHHTMCHCFFLLFLCDHLFWLTIPQFSIYFEMHLLSKWQDFMYTRYVCFWNVWKAVSYSRVCPVILSDSFLSDSRMIQFPYKIVPLFYQSPSMPNDQLPRQRIKL